LLLASCLFAFSAEYPTSIFEFCTNIAAVFSPTVTVAILTIPALFATIRYLAPERTWRSIVPMLLCGALFLTPVVPGVTSWSLYFFFGMTGALLVAKGIDPLCGDVVVATARKAWDSIARIPWPLFVFAAAAIHLTLSIAICFWWFGAVPHVIDSVAQLFQAKILAEGALTAPAPPTPKAFDCIHFVIRNGRWYSIYFPAHPFVISLFLRLGIAPLTNGFVGVAGILGIAQLARLVAGDRIARLAILLTLISPWWLLMHGEMMNHVTAGAALTWAFVLFMKGGRQSSSMATLLFSVGAGLLFGVAFLVRPYTPLLTGAALFCFALWRAMRGDRRWLICTLVIAIVAIPALLAMLRINISTTGSPLLTAYEAKYGPGVGPGFHPPPWGPPHTPFLGLRNVLADLNALDRWVLGLPVPLIVVLAGLRRRWALPGWIWTVPFALLAGHFAFWYVDFCFGPRFLFESLPCLLIIVAMSLRELWLRAQRRLVLFGSAALLIAPAIWLGFYQSYGKGFYGIANQTAAIAASLPPDALVLMAPEQFGAFIWRNDPWLKKGPVYAENIGPENPDVMAAFPHRRLFYVEGTRQDPRITIATPVDTIPPPASASP
jgi:hypothetical protein